MPQTLLALCAILVFAIYSLNSTRNEAASERRSVTFGAEEAAATTARARLAAAERLAFDEEDVGRTDRGIRILPPASLVGPDAGETDATMFDDLDDFDGLTETRTTLAGSDRESSGRTLDFAVTYRVRYVNPATLAAAGGPTLAKEVSIHVEEVTTGRTGRPAVVVDLRKVFTPAAMTSQRR